MIDWDLYRWYTQLPLIDLQEGEEDKDTAKPSDNGNNDNKKETAKNILTGDPVSVFLYTSIMLVSLAIALVCFIYGRKNKKKKIHS